MMMSGGNQPRSNDELDSSDEDDHQPPSQVFLAKGEAASAIAALHDSGAAPHGTKAAKFDQLLKVSDTRRA